MNGSDTVLKCRFCAYTVLAWRTQRNGRTRSGWEWLADHVQDHHPAVANELTRVCGSEWEEEVAYGAATPPPRLTPIEARTQRRLLAFNRQARAEGWFG